MPEITMVMAGQTSVILIPAHSEEKVTGKSATLTDQIGRNFEIAFQEQSKDGLAFLWAVVRQLY